MYSIDIKSDSRYPIDRDRIRGAIEDVLLKEGLKSEVEVSVFVVGKRKMHGLNLQWRGLDYATNVLSFCQNETKEGSDEYAYPDNQVLYLGDVVVCYPVAREQARESWLMVDDWIETLVRHSMEHLLGRHHV